MTNFLFIKYMQFTLFLSLSLFSFLTNFCITISILLLFSSSIPAHLCEGGGDGAHPVVGTQGLEALRGQEGAQSCPCSHLVLGTQGSHLLKRNLLKVLSL